MLADVPKKQLLFGCSERLWCRDMKDRLRMAGVLGFAHHPEF
jgi:hypothetical protein